MKTTPLGEQTLLKQSLKTLFTQLSKQNDPSISWVSTYHDKIIFGEDKNAPQLITEPINHYVFFDRYGKLTISFPGKIIYFVFCTKFV